jgi:hypothetical protein
MLCRAVLEHIEECGIHSGTRLLFSTLLISDETCAYRAITARLDWLWDRGLPTSNLLSKMCRALC